MNANRFHWSFKVRNIRVVQCSVHIFDMAIFYYFCCDAHFLLFDKKTFHTGCLLNNLICRIQAQGATPSYTQKLIETYDRTPSRKGHATPLLTAMVIVFLMIDFWKLCSMLTMGKIVKRKRGVVDCGAKQMYTTDAEKSISKMYTACCLLLFLTSPWSFFR